MRSTAVKSLTLLATLLALACLYELYRWVWVTTGWTWPFAVNDITLPHLWTIFKALGEPSRFGGPLLITVLLKSALFTGKEALLGFTMGALFGFLLAILLVQSGLAQRAFLPYIVASQTIPILAIAPMVVVGLGNLTIAGWTPAHWLRVSVIAAYLTFFPVTVNTVRGLQSADRAAVELMQSYAAREWAVFWKLRVPSALPYLFAAFRISATACVVGAIIGELPSSIQDGLGGAILNFNQYYVLNPENLWATNLIAALLGIGFFLVIVLAEKLLVHRPPERLV
jgi:ABC-type nitrate/sulfonate/bicarbonate transport system, permease component